VPVVGIDDATAIDAGLRFTCAIRADHSVWCWGEDPGSDAASALPFQVPGIDEATAVTAGGQFACVLRSSGQIGCWGNGQAGQLGNGVYENNSGVPTPQSVLGIDNAIAVSAGWGHACALLADRTVECWGANGDGASVYGSLGDGSSDLRRATPAPVSGLDNVKAIQVGGWTSCATRLDGTVWCWGYGEQGEMGDGNFSNSSVPTQVALIDDAGLLAVGDHAACVSRSDDSVWCWGHTNWIGQDNPGSEDPGKPRQGNKSTPRVVAALATARYCLLIDGRGQMWDWSFGTNPAPQRRPVGP
jgi:alpha-tubulin suppressor-like RCC1 family protein